MEYIKKLLILLIGSSLALVLVPIFLALTSAIIVVFMLILIVLSPLLAVFAERNGWNIKIGNVNMFAIQTNKDNQ